MNNEQIWKEQNGFFVCHLSRYSFCSRSIVSVQIGSDLYWLCLLLCFHSFLPCITGKREQGRRQRVKLELNRLTGTTWGESVTWLDIIRYNSDYYDTVRSFVGPSPMNCFLLLCLYVHVEIVWNKRVWREGTQGLASVWLFCSFLLLSFLSVWVARGEGEKR